LKFILKQLNKLRKMDVFLISKPHSMSKLLWLLSIVAIITSACNTQEKAELQSKVDSLTVELETSQRMARTLQDVGVLMDSIDANRQLLRVNMVEGTTYENYTSRMKDLNNYVRDTEKKIEDLEKQLKKSRGNANAFASTIKKLKAELFSKSEEIAALQEQVETQRNENQNLSQTIKLQEDELSAKDEQIRAKEEELALIETKIQELMINSKVSEADAYYARAQAVEETANRTKLAPKKKKASYKEAIELYKKSLSLGKKEAQAKITELEKKIK
jgi:chromosome segregation ATPase